MDLYNGVLTRQLSWGWFKVGREPYAAKAMMAWLNIIEVKKQYKSEGYNTM